jgi:hypothetical protein
MSIRSRIHSRSRRQQSTSPSGRRRWRYSVLGLILLAAAIAVLQFSLLSPSQQEDLERI